MTRAEKAFIAFTGLGVVAFGPPFWAGFLLGGVFALWLVWALR